MEHINYGDFEYKGRTFKLLLRKSDNLVQVQLKLADDKYDSEINYGDAKSEKTDRESVKNVAEEMLKAANIHK